MDKILAYVIAASLTFGVNPDVIMCTLRGESGLNPAAVNGPNHGIAQFNEDSWAWWAPMAQEDLGYLPTDPYDWQQAVDLMVWCFAHGYAEHWHVYRVACTQEPVRGPTRVPIQIKPVLLAPPARTVPVWI